MRAMVLERARPVAEAPLVERDLPVPEPGPDEVRLRVRACGVCHTDLHLVEGDLPLARRPLVPGHQVVGVVEARGHDVREPPEGARVGVPWLHRTCGACRWCARGEENLCERALFTGLSVDGGFAEAMVAPAAFVYPLPAALADDAAAAPLLCAGVIGWRALRRAEVEPGDVVALWGFGGSAHVAIQILVHLGCRVQVFTRGAEHRALARRLGAAWVGGAADTPPEKARRAVSFAPSGQLVPRALELLDRGGTLALAGIHLDRIPELDYGTHLFQERTLRSVTASTRRDAEELLAMAAEIPIRTDVERFALGEANRALRGLAEGTLGAAAAVLQM